MRPASVGIFALLSTFIVAFTATGVSAASDRMTIRSHPDVGGKCIDVPYAQFSPGMRVQMWTCNGGASQAFSHNDQSQQLQIGGLCVEAWGRGDPQDGVGLGTCDGKPNQQWRMQASGNYYQIIGTNGLCLEVRYGAKDDGAALDLMTCDATRAQRLWVVIDGHAETPTAEKAANESRSTAQGQTFLGCFKDNVKPEDLGPDAFAERSDNLTGARCVATCRAGGYRFAATQNGSACICGNVYGFSGAADNCDLRCSGNRAEACGGFNANSIYAANELPVESASSPFVGTWMSNRGPYTFVAEGTQIGGWFQHGSSEKGSLTDGRYDPATRQLRIASNQEWNGERATLTLTLAPTGRTMMGTYQQSNGSGSPVAMQLALRGDPPSAAAARPHGMTVSNKPRIEVLPVLFIPSDATWVTQRDIDLYSYLIFAHLELVQQHYKAALKTDTFKISSEPMFVYRAEHNDAYYRGGPNTAEILRARHQDRYSTNNIFLIVYVRATPRTAGMPIFAGGRTFNGAPNAGGGSLELELTAVLYDDALGFQAALIHELGHTFGMVHPDAYGYDMHTNGSNMSYNEKSGGRGLNPAMFGQFNPEEFFTMGQNKRVFPDFSYVPAVHNPSGKKFHPVYFGCMNDEIGTRRGAHGNVCTGYPCPCP